MPNLLLSPLVVCEGDLEVLLIPPQPNSSQEKNGLTYHKVGQSIDGEHEYSSRSSHETPTTRERASKQENTVKTLHQMRGSSATQSKTALHAKIARSKANELQTKKESQRVQEGKMPQ